jgi:hypothetical protein
VQLHKRHNRYSKRLGLLCLVALLGLETGVFSQSSRQLPKSHRHIGIEKSTGAEITEFSMTETSLETGIEKENVVTNRNRNYEAFTVSGSRLFVADKATKKVFEIRGLLLEWRPFSNLTWANNQTLMFDRWSQPHYGVHYAVNVKNKRLVAAVPFPDTLYLDQHPRRPTNRE